MNLVIITPGHPGPDRKSLPPASTAPFLAALATPYAKNIKIFDLAVQPFELNGSIPDVALFTTTMAQFDHIYEIAGYLKAKGTTIFFGGPYATLAHDFDPRIKDVADCVVLGEGEKALPRALEDYSSGNLEPTYNMPIDSLDGIPFSRLDLLDNRKYCYSTVVFGTRGCVNSCAYCSIKYLYGQKYLKRPVDEVIEEIKFQTSRPNLWWRDRKMVMFWDDNPHCDLDWFHELLEKMIPLKKWWLSQTCLSVADNEETVKLMKASGCRGIFVGIESVSRESLKGQNKETVNRVDNYIRQTRVLLKHGINIIGAMMFGFEQDTKESLFNDTLEIVEQMGLTLLQCHIFTPYPHLDYFKKLNKENRVITTEAKYYNGYTLIHEPAKIHPADLQEGFINIRKQFYSWRSILKRMLKHNLSKFPEFLIENIMFIKPNYESIPGVDIKKWLSYLKNRLPMTINRTGKDEDSSFFDLKN
jgi:radical SAM superfamily enzyme YgiQ (UPF0313 family)